MVEPGIFALPPGVDFARAFVEGLAERMAGQPPEAMARVELYLGTPRMLRRVRALFDTGEARFLPRLRLITDLGRDPLAGIPPAVPTLRRRLELAQLIGDLVARQPDFAPATGTYDLARSLAALMAEMQGEGVAPAALERLDVGEHAAHWQRSLAFIRIIARWFDAGSLPDADMRQRLAVDALVARWAAAPPAHPVIVAGSTGSRGATALLMRAVARLPAGAVVLPGFDAETPAHVWDALRSGEVPAEDHPQYRFAALLASLGDTPANVRAWRKVEAPAPARNRLVSLALRPAPVTDQWMAEGAHFRGIEAAAEGMTLVEAPDPRTEAMAIALRLRAAVAEGRRAALVSPDRMLTRRVAAALDRWGIEPDDSAGQPLHLSPPGRLLRHLAGAMGRKMTIQALIVLLKHPLTATGAGGTGRGAHLRLTRRLELHLRRKGPAFPGPAALRCWAAAADAPDWGDWLAALIADLGAVEEAPLADLLAVHLELAGRLAAGPGGSVEASGLWQREGGAEALASLVALAREAASGGRFDPAGYADLLGALLEEGQVRQAEATLSPVAIRGPREARVLGEDLVILAGLNEGVWPAAPAPDPWLSRRMRLAAGLLLPERQVGLSAHDFQLAVAAPEVILTRAARDADAETVPSRWLNRLTNLMGGLDGGAGALEAMRARGRLWLDRAAALERPPAALPPAGRPAPRPPAAARPRELPVTAIRTLIRDPYAIYAERILRLRPLDPLLPEADPRLRGKVLHAIVEAFLRDRPDGEPPEAGAARLVATAERVLAQEVAWPFAQRMWRARIARIAPRFAADEAARAARGRPAVIEAQGRVTLPALGFTLTARPDRIDLLDDGRVHIYDYKSGTLPSAAEMAAFDKQLLLEAAMAARGGFAVLGPREVEGVSHLRLGGAGEVARHDVDAEDIAAAWAGLERLIAAYLASGTGYVARRAMQKTTDVGDYDHLARFGEWDMTDPPAPEDVGTADVGTETEARPDDGG